MKKKTLALLIAVSMAVQCAPAGVYAAEFFSEAQEVNASDSVFFSEGDMEYGAYGTGGNAEVSQADKTEDTEATVPGAGDTEAAVPDAGNAEVTGETSDIDQTVPIIDEGDSEIFSAEGETTDLVAEPETLSTEDFRYQIINSEITIVEYYGQAETVKVPEKIGEYPVTAIGEKAFAETTCLEVELPEGVKTIGSKAFLGCQNLTKVVLPSSVEKIEEDTFLSSLWVVLYCYSDSYALQYAKEHTELLHKVIDEVKTDISACDIQMEASVVCTGEALMPEVVMKNAEQTLVLDQDYTVEYVNNTNPGTATVTVKGIGAYEGTVEKTFKITLAAPKIVSAVSKDYNAIEVTWEAVPGAKSYDVYYKGAAGKNWKKIGTGVTATSFVHTASSKYPMTAGKKYMFTVKAVCDKIRSGCDKVGKTAVPTLTAPKLGSVTSAAYNKVKVTWNAVPGATGYYVYRKVGKSWKRLADVKGTVYIDGTVSKYPVKTGVTYTYTVKAYRKTGSLVAAGAVDKVGIQGKAVPEKPVLVSAEYTGTNKITLRWKKAAGATNYLVYRKVPGGKWQMIKNISGASMIGYTHVGSKEFPIEKGKTYIYTVRSYTTTGNTRGLCDAKGISVKAVSAAVTAQEQAEKNAKEIVAKITNAGMSQSQKLKVCFDWVIRKPYVTRRAFSNFAGWPAVFANDHFVLGGGNCHSDAAAFAYLAKALGYTNVYVCTDSDGRRGLAHSWAEVNGLVYDPLFAEAKSYYRYFGVSYRTYELDPILHIAI